MNYFVLIIALVYGHVSAKLREDFHSELAERLQRLEKIVTKLATEAEQIHLSRQKRAYADPAVSFSVALDQALYNIVIGQTIVFNKVLLNDGKSYNSNSGIFTVPLDGVYLFSYFVGERGDDEVVLRLVVNGQNQVDAVAEGVQDGHNDQGGNVAILRLKAGDLVCIEAYDISNVHIDGAPDYKFASFSGVLLYLDYS